MYLATLLLAAAARSHCLLIQRRPFTCSLINGRCTSAARALAGPRSAAVQQVTCVVRRTLGSRVSFLSTSLVQPLLPPHDDALRVQLLLSDAERSVESRCGCSLLRKSAALSAMKQKILMSTRDQGIFCL
jgi:hypothetical protein